MQQYEVQITLEVEIKGKDKKGKRGPVNAMKAYSGCRGTAPLILNFDTRWR
jgi:hypothetical protein